jgi:hypothetical protein
VGSARNRIWQFNFGDVDFNEKRFSRLPKNSSFQDTVGEIVGGRAERSVSSRHS